MKRTLFFMLLSALLLGGAATAQAEIYSGECGAEGDNLTWTLDTQTGVLAISGTGAMKDYSNDTRTPWYYYRTSITSVTIGESITRIGNHAFSGCSGLHEVTIGKNVTSIGNYAFSSCDSLTSVTIGSSVTAIGNHAFFDCNRLTEVTIPNSVTTIGDYAFFGCSGLHEVTIGNNVTTIGSDAFAYCTGLTSVTIPESVTSIDTYAFAYCTGLTEVTIPNSVTAIGECAFSGCSGLHEVTIGNNVTTIGSDAFAYCTGLTEVTIPNSVTAIGSSAFYYCRGLTSVTIPNSITTIGESAFSGCTGLERFEGKFASGDGRCLIVNDTLKAFAPNCGVAEYTIPNSVTAIGSSAFYYCWGLTSVTIPEGVQTIGSSAFSGCTGLERFEGKFASEDGRCLIVNDTLKAFAPSGLNRYAIPDGVTAIGDEAFEGCTGLKEITIPNSVTAIGDEAFEGCTGLKEITIPNSVTSIGEEAFGWCDGLTSVTIGDGVTTIGDYAFNSCSSLTSVTIPNSVTAIGTWAFSMCDGLKEVWFNADSCVSGGFSGCSALATVHIGDNVKWIPKNAFSGCKNLTSVTIGNGVTAIGDNAFSECSGLSEITIPESVTAIGNGAFYSCSGLHEVAIGKSVTIIGDYTFSGCTGLKNLRIEDGTKTLKLSTSSSFDDCPLDTVYLGRNIDYSYGSGYNTYYNSPFKDKTNLISLTIGNQVTSIDNSAFSGCTGLKNLRIEDGTKTLKLSTSSSSTPFDDCLLDTVYLGRNISYSYYSPFKDKTNLISLTIGNQVTSIDNSAFSGCTGLKNLRIEDGTKTLKLSTSSSFDDCPLDTVYLGRNIDYSYSSGYNTYYNSPFKDKTNLISLTIGNQVTSIDNSAFSGCSGLKNLRIEDGTKTLTLSTSSSSTPFVSCPLDTVYLGRNISYSYYSPFENKTSLISLTIGNQVTSIDNSAFSGCTGLKNLRIEDGTKTLKLSTSSSFDDCPLDTVYLGRNIDYSYSSGYNTYYNSPFKDKTNLISLTIGSQVTSIDNSAFSGCMGLAEITIPNSVTTIGDYAFSGCSSLKEIWFNADSCISGGFAGCTALTTVHIGENVKRIPSSAFSDCTGLTEVTIPDSVTSIGEEAFCRCYDLTSVTIGDGVTTIGDYAFNSCSSLTSVTIPESVDSIGNYAFSGWRNLQEITPLGTIPPSINDNTFDQYIYQNATVNYPKGSLHIYKNADGWKNFTYPSVQTILDLQIDSNIGETTCRITISYTPDMEYPVRGLSFCMGEEQFTFDSTQTVIPLTFADLDPQTRYEAQFIIETVYGEQVVTPITFTTNAVRLTAQPAKNTDVKATFEAEVECDAETGYGFEWRRHGAPDNVPPARVEAYNIDGKIAGTLRNLTPNTYYEFRPYYRSASGKYYYGSYAGKDNWIGFGTFDYGVEWDPAVNTRTSEVHGNNSTISAYVVEGSDELLSQGFEYWAESPAAHSTESIATRSTASEPKRIEGSGTLMSVTLTGLDYNTTYYYRAYATTAKKTTYGNTESFTTGEDPNLSGIEETEAAANAEFEVRLSGNPVRNGEIGVQVVGADGATWYRVISLHGSLITQGVLSGTDEWQPVKIPAASTGYYLLQIIGSKGTKTLRIVVE